MYFLTFILFLFQCLTCFASFYLIEPERFLTYRACDHETPFERKHFNAVFFLDGLREHPLRTFDPEQADLVFVPSLFDLLFTGKCHGYHRDHFLNDTIDVIHSTHLYPVKKHVMLAFSVHFKVIDGGEPYRAFRRRVPGVLFTAWEDFRTQSTHYHEPYEFAVPYGNNYDYDFFYSGAQHHRIHFTHLKDPNNLPFLRDPSYQSFMKRPLFVEFIGSVDTRAAYQDRYLLFNNSTPLFTSRFDHPVWITTSTSVKAKPFFGPHIKNCDNNANIMTYIHNTTVFENVFDRCRIEVTRHESQVIRENARFSLCFHGDTLGSDRWFNAFLSGTIIAAVGESVEEVVSWTPFQDVIPWEDVIVFILQREFHKNPIATINQLASLSRDEIEKRLSLMAKHAADISFIASNSRVVDNIINAAIKTNCP
eukprot:gene5639-6059_t